MVAPTRRRRWRAAKASPSISERPLRRCATVRIAGGRQPRQRQRSQWDASPSPSPCLKTAHAPKLRVLAAPATCTLSPHLSHLVEHSRRSRRSLSFSLPYSKLDPTRDTHKRESSTRRASVGLATLPTRPRGKGVSRKVRAGSWPARAGCPVRCAPKRRGQGSGFSA